MSQPQLGERIKALRKAKNYTIEQVSTLCGLSKSFISMLENGRTNVSATKLEKLASIFGLRASDLLPDASSQALIHVVRKNEGATVKGFGAGINAHLLSNDFHRRIQPVLLTLEPGATLENETGHAGEEFVFILSGRLQLTVDEYTPVTLESGDSAYYPCALSHTFKNVSKAVTSLLTISTPPKLV